MYIMFQEAIYEILKLQNLHTFGKALQLTISMWFLCKS